jgi:hypothetical protein
MEENAPSTSSGISKTVESEPSTSGAAYSKGQGPPTPLYTSYILGESVQSNSAIASSKSKSRPSSSPAEANGKGQSGQSSSPNVGNIDSTCLSTCNYDHDAVRNYFLRVQFKGSLRMYRKAEIFRRKILNKIHHGSDGRTIADACYPCIVRVESLAKNSGIVNVNQHEGDFSFNRRPSLVFAFPDDLAGLGPFQLHVLLPCNEE